MKYFKIVFFCVIVSLLTNCKSLAKLNGNELSIKLEAADPLKSKSEEIRNLKTCKDFLAKDKIEYSQALLLKLIEEEAYISMAKVECIISTNFSDGIALLINHITDRREVGLKDHFNINIMDRIETGYMDLEYGEVTNDDLFRVSGRSNYLLKELTGQDFGFARMKSSKKELKNLQHKWINWVESL